MYTPEGVKITSVLGPRTTRLIPWDSARDVTLKESRIRCRRRKLVLRPEHFPIFVIGNGVGGFSRARDVGSTLVVDFLPDGRRIDVLVKGD